MEEQYLLGEEEMQQGAALYLCSLPAGFLVLRAVIKAGEGTSC